MNNKKTKESVLESIEKIGDKLGEIRLLVQELIQYFLKPKGDGIFNFYDTFNSFGDDYAKFEVGYERFRDIIYKCLNDGCQIKKRKYRFRIL